MRKFLPKILIALYVIILIWLVLFKFSFNIPSVFEENNRLINLIPFASPVEPYTINFTDIIYNCLFFIPFGLLLNVNFKKIKFSYKLLFIFIFSLSAELIQLIFAIGTTDITDLITNTLGGFIGFKIYDIAKNHISEEKLDKIITYVGIILLIGFITVLSNIFVRRVYYK